MPPHSPRSDQKSAAECSGTRGGRMPEVAVPLPVQPPAPLSAGPTMPLTRFNDAPTTVTTTLLLRCCGSRRWAARIADCRPYPDMDALLAALDEASYDMTREDLTEALELEEARLPFPNYRAAEAAGDKRGILAAHTALRAAHSAYEQRFGHAFLICLDAYRPDEWLDQALVGVRSRLGNDAEDERAVAAEELRNIARGRLKRLVAARRT